MTERPAYPNRYLIDFDDTLCKTRYENGKWVMGEANDEVANKVTDLSWDNEIIIFTARPRSNWPDVRAWLDKEAIRYHKIKHKPLAKMIVDDRSMRPEEFIKDERIK